MFVGERGRFLLPHWDFARLIVEGNYEKLDFPDLEEQDHYHQFIDACMDKAVCSTPFSYSARLSESVLLGVLAHSFPEQTLHFNQADLTFAEPGANQLLDAPYRSF